MFKLTIYTAKTLEDLLANAAKEKNVNVSELTHHILEEKKGLLGLGASVRAEVFCLNDVKEFIFDYLGTFFTNFEQEIEIEILMDNKIFKVLLNSENNAILIGKNGQTLQAINTVVRSAVNATFKGRFNVFIDINNYKEDRYAKVKALANRVARSVQKSKIAAALDPMPNDERKVIHQFLSTFENIRTESEGEGRDRHLKIFYQDSSNNH